MTPAMQVYADIQRECEIRVAKYQYEWDFLQSQKAREAEIAEFLSAAQQALAVATKVIADYVATLTPIDPIVTPVEPSQ